MIAQTCLHCEKCPASNSLGLCGGCYRVGGIRTLYRVKPHHTPEFLGRIKRMTERAKRKLPLFGEARPAPGGQGGKYAAQ